MGVAVVAALPVVDVLMGQAALRLLIAVQLVPVTGGAVTVVVAVVNQGLWIASSLELKLKMKTLIWPWSAFVNLIKTRMG